MLIRTWPELAKYLHFDWEQYWPGFYLCLERDLLHLREPWISYLALLEPDEENLGFYCRLTKT